MNGEIPGNMYFIRDFPYYSAFLYSGALLRTYPVPDISAKYRAKERERLFNCSLFFPLGKNKLQFYSIYPAIENK